LAEIPFAFGPRGRDTFHHISISNSIRAARQRRPTGRADLLVRRHCGTHQRHPAQAKEEVRMQKEEKFHFFILHSSFCLALQDTVSPLQDSGFFDYLESS
jgi:hypothetical protein